MSVEFSGGVGIEEFLINVNRITEKTNKLVEDGIGRAGLILELQMKNNLSGPILNVITGTLRRSVGIRLRRLGLRSEVAVGSGVALGSSPVAYALIHETGGTINNAFGRGFAIRIPARRWMTRSLETAKDRIIAAVQEALRRGLS